MEMTPTTFQLVVRVLSCESIGTGFSVLRCDLPTYDRFPQKDLGLKSISRHQRLDNIKLKAKAKNNSLLVLI